MPRDPPVPAAGGKRARSPRRQATPIGGGQVRHLRGGRRRLVEATVGEARGSWNGTKTPCQSLREAIHQLNGEEPRLARIKERGVASHVGQPGAVRFTLTRTLSLSLSDFPRSFPLKGAKGGSLGQNVHITVLTDEYDKRLRKAGEGDAAD